MLRKERWIKREKLNAVHDDDLEQILSSLHVLQEIRRCQHRCLVCGTEITLENLAAIYPKDGKINFVCERVSCIGQLTLAEGESSDGLD